MDYVGKHTFSGPMLKQLAREALQHTQFRKPYETDTTTEPSFWLVKDSGVYLIQAHKHEIKDRLVVRPVVEPGVGELMGSDDTIEMITIGTNAMTVLAGEDATLEVRIDLDEVVTSVRRPAHNNKAPSANSAMAHVAMAQLDEHRETIPDGVYLTIANALGRLNDK